VLRRHELQAVCVELELLRHTGRPEHDNPDEARQRKISYEQGNMPLSARRKSNVVASVWKAQRNSCIYSTDNTDETTGMDKRQNAQGIKQLNVCTIYIYKLCTVHYCTLCKHCLHNVQEHTFNATDRQARTLVYLLLTTVTTQF
jgi:hypothetical protein